MKQIFLLIISLILIYTINVAQSADNCIDAQNLCASQPLLGSNESATAQVCSGCEDAGSANGNFCYSTENTIWYQFETNNSGGTVNIDISNINCLSANGYGNQLQASLISASIPCDESTYSLITGCEAGFSNNLTLSASNLPAKTTYYLQIDGDTTGGPLPAECSFTINASGSGIEVNLSASGDTSIVRGDAHSIQGNNYPDAFWTPNESISDVNDNQVVVSPDFTTTYYYSYVSNNGCLYQSPVVITVLDNIIITNTFSPNGDGINDRWFIGGLEPYISAEVEVFDRWGQKIFKSTGYTPQKSWDGTFNGSRLPAGTYFYTIDLNAGSENDLLSGYVVLLK